VDEARKAVNETRWLDAVNQANRALALLGPAQAASPDVATNTYEVLGLAEMSLLNFGEARAAFTKQLALLESQGQGASEGAALSLQRSALTLTRERHFSDAEPLLKRALELRRRLGERPPIAQTLADVASLYVQATRYPDARAALDEGAALLEPGDEANDAALFHLQMVRAEYFRYQGNLRASLQPFADAADAASRHEATLAGDALEALLRLGDTQSSLEQRQAAVSTLERALALSRRHPDLHKAGVQVTFALLLAYRGNNQAAQADALFGSNASATRTLHVRSHTFDNTVPPDDSAQERTLVQSAPKPAVMLADVGQVVNSMRMGFRDCYQAGLGSDRTMSGSLRLRIDINSEGAVETASIQSIGLSVAVVDCVLENAGAGKFSPPDGGHAQITVPVTFVPTPPSTATGS